MGVADSSEKGSHPPRARTAYGDGKLAYENDDKSVDFFLESGRRRLWSDLLSGTSHFQRLVNGVSREFLDLDSQYLGNWTHDRSRSSFPK